MIDLKKNAKNKQYYQSHRTKNRFSAMPLYPHQYQFKIHRTNLLLSCVVDFFIDNGRELYGFGCIAFVLFRRIIEFVDGFVCVMGFDSFGHDSLSELRLSKSAAAAASFTKQI